MYKDANHYTLYRRGDIWGYYWYDSNNKRHYRSTGRKTKHEAQKVINSRIKEGKLAYDQNTSPILLKDFAKDFFVDGKCPIQKECIRTGKSMQASTMYPYRKNMEKHIFPYFGNMLMDNIGPDDIRSFEDKLKRDGLANTSIVNIEVSLRHVMSHAVRVGRIDKNPFDSIVNMQPMKKTRNGFTIEQVQALLSKEWSSFICQIAFKWCCLTGMRIGEVQALKVSSVSDGMIHVDSNWAAAIKTVKDTKNHESRVIPMPTGFQEDYDYLSYNKSPDMFLFSENGEKPFSRDMSRNCLHERMEDCGIPTDSKLTWHSSRHFFDTYMGLNTDVNVEKIMSVMGHKSLEMYRHYLHVQANDLSEVKKEQDKLTTKLTTKQK